MYCCSGHTGGRELFWAACARHYARGVFEIYYVTLICHYWRWQSYTLDVKPRARVCMTILVPEPMLALAWDG